MQHHTRPSLLIPMVLCLMAMGTAGAATPVVKSTCTISWDEGEGHPEIFEYRITVWMVNGQKAPKKTIHVVKAPTTQVSCKEVGANKVGHWQATVQACLKDGTCSQASQPLSFQVADK
jgi:hypothetical protein